MTMRRWLGLGSTGIGVTALGWRFGADLRFVASDVARFIGNWWPVALILAGLCAIAWPRMRTRLPATGSATLPGAHRFTLLRWRWVALGAVLITVSIVGAVWWLLAMTSTVGRTPTPQGAQVRIEAVRTGLSVGAGLAGAFALLLAARRQWLGERAQWHSEDDAEERRFTELYTKAVDQLGGDNAAVRIGGLYALERLAQGNASHRQAIVNVVCAYLRLPYEAPPELNTPSAYLERQSHDGSESDMWNVEDNIDQFYDRRPELQARLTAQRILTDHLRPDSGHAGGFWPAMHLDLTGAVLVDFSLSGCEVASVRIGGARFLGAQHPGRVELDDQLTEQIARTLHNVRTRLRERGHGDEDAAWEDLPRELRQAVLAQVAAIEHMLNLIGCGLAVGPSDHDFSFTSAETELLAIYEHERWRNERIANGWSYASSRNDEAKQHPALAPYPRLRGSFREQNSAALRKLPDILTEAGLHIYRLRN